MAFRLCAVPSTLLFLGAAIVWAQQTTDSPPIVQPGAPGQSSRTLTKDAAAAIGRKAPAPADISFMQGMIMHHNQAVEMVGLMRARSTNRKLLAFGERIRISQTDEMQFMRQWLTDRGAPVEMPMNKMDMSKMGDMKGMDHSKMAMDMSRMNQPMMMPGMLTPEQMKALAAAKGPAFDRLFLTGMIQHHGGALTMVTDLINTPGAGQDAVLFDFATDVDNTQSAEIEIMKGLLREEK